MVFPIKERFLTCFQHQPGREEGDNEQMVTRREEELGRGGVVESKRGKD